MHWRSGLLVCVLVLTAMPVQADSIWQWTHEGSAAGMANVFDGGPVDVDSDSTNGLMDDDIGLFTSDRTDQSGVLGAQALAVANSTIFPEPDVLVVSQNFTVGYIPSNNIGGDNPGGEATGQMDTVVEFVLPFDDAQWFSRLDIETDFNNVMNGETRVFVENVTRSSMIELFNNGTSALIEFDFDTSAGDVIRLTTSYTASGNTGGPSGLRVYDVNQSLIVRIPEPGTLMLLAVGALGVSRRRGQVVLP